MTEVASRELRNNTRSVLDRVASGEKVTITVDGRAVAELVPVAPRPRWLSRADFVARVLDRQADAGLATDLDDFTGGETTDDLRWR